MAKIAFQASKREQMGQDAAYEMTLRLQSELDHVWSRVPSEVTDPAHLGYDGRSTGQALCKAKFFVLRVLHLRFYVPGWLEPQKYSRSRDLAAQAAFDVVELMLQVSRTQDFLRIAKAVQADDVRRERNAPSSAPDQEDKLYVHRLHLASGGWLGRLAALAGNLLQHHLYLMQRYDPGPIRLSDQQPAVRAALAELKPLLDTAGSIWQIPANVVEGLITSHESAQHTSHCLSEHQTNRLQTLAAAAVPDSTTTGPTLPSLAPPLAPTPNAPPQHFPYPLLPTFNATTQGQYSPHSLESDTALIMDQPWFSHFEQSGLFGLDMGSMFPGSEAAAPQPSMAGWATEGPMGPSTSFLGALQGAPAAGSAGWTTDPGPLNM